MKKVVCRIFIYFYLSLLEKKSRCECLRNLSNFNFVSSGFCLYVTVRNFIIKRFCSTIILSKFEFHSTKVMWKKIRKMYRLKLLSVWVRNDGSSTSLVIGLPRYHELRRSVFTKPEMFEAPYKSFSNGCDKAIRAAFARITAIEAICIILY